MSVRRFRKKPVEVEARRVPEVYTNGDDRGIMEYVSECIELFEATYDEVIDEIKEI